MKLRESELKELNRLRDAGIPVDEALEWARSSCWQDRDELAHVVECLDSDLYEGERNGAPSLKQARRWLTILKKIASASAAERAAEEAAAEAAEKAAIEATWGVLVPPTIPADLRRRVINECRSRGSRFKTREDAVRSVWRELAMERIEQWANDNRYVAVERYEVGGDNWIGHDESAGGLSGGDYVTETRERVACWAQNALERLTAGWDLSDETVDNICVEELEKLEAEWDAAEKFMNQFGPWSPLQIVFDGRKREVRIERRASAKIRVVARAVWDVREDRYADIMTKEYAILHGIPVPSCIKALMVPGVVARIERVKKAKVRLGLYKEWKEEKSIIRINWKSWYRSPHKGPYRKKLSPRGEALWLRIREAQDRAVALRKARLEAERRKAEQAKAEAFPAAQDVDGGIRQPDKFYNNPFVDLKL